MRNKILIVDADPSARQALEEILQEVVEKGGEFLFASTQEDGLTLLTKEHPQLVFVDTLLLGENEEAWNQEGVHVVVMQIGHQQDQYRADVLLKPLRPHQVLEKCQAFLGKEISPQMPPM
ncbi:MAG: hypothetical protein S4CHLAM2_06060 [Chlamydiales bacterium]|nr:hypothetical protein [Chlamydiales bacterium]